MKEIIQNLLEKAILSLPARNASHSDAGGNLDANLDLCDILVDYPKAEKFGDYSTNVALILAKKNGGDSMKIAQDLVKKLGVSPSAQPKDTKFQKIEIANEIRNPQNVSPLEKGEGKGVFEKIEVVKPGFINFHLAPKYFQELVEKINAEENNFGNSQIGQGVKVNK